MKPRILLFLFFAIPALIINSCKRHDRIGDSDPVVNDAETVTAGITGIVVNENNIPLPGITVTSGSNTATTDRYGMFRFSNISISKKNATVKVAQVGYFTAYRTFPAKAGIIHNVRIKLIPKTNAGAISASAGGTVNITGGGKVVIPASAVTDASGNAYSGMVNVAMTWIDPTSPQLNSIMMGDLRGVTAGGQERVLETYGMLGVELTGSGGQTLKIAPGKIAELTFPIPASLQSAAPATIPLWHFDEATARWKEEGTATKSGSNYTGNVSHFSFWNCDVQWPQINLCIQLVNNDKPLGNLNVRIRRVNTPSSVSTGRTDSLGNICGIVPKDEPLMLEVLDGCGNIVYTQNIGPFSNDASIVVNVTVPIGGLITITGNVTGCNNTPVSNGYVLIYYPGNYITTQVINGSFSATVLNCNGSVIGFSVFAVDNATQQQGVPTPASAASGIINMGTLQACGASSAEYFEFLIDGVPTIVLRPDSLQAVVANTTSTPPVNTDIFARHFYPDYRMISITMNFFHAAAPVSNSYPLNFIGMWMPGPSLTPVNGSISANNPVVPLINVTEFGAPTTGFIAGNFSALIRIQGETNDRMMTCSYRIRRR